MLIKNEIIFPIIPAMQLKPDQLKDFLISHLNRIYCAKAHLYERLPELADLADFSDLKYAITETWEDIGKQIERILEIYHLIKEEPSLENCEDLIEFIENGFNPIYEKSSEPTLRDLSVLFYMSIIESIETTSFNLLQMAAVCMCEPEISDLLQQNADASQADRRLFIHIAAKYVSSRTT